MNAYHHVKHITNFSDILFPYRGKRTLIINFFVINESLFITSIYKIKGYVRC